MYNNTIGRTSSSFKNTAYLIIVINSMFDLSVKVCKVDFDNLFTASWALLKRGCPSCLLLEESLHWLCWCEARHIHYKVKAGDRLAGKAESAFISISSPCLTVYKIIFHYMVSYGGLLKPFHP